jgi:hypothetical protein
LSLLLLSWPLRRPSFALLKLALSLAPDASLGLEGFGFGLSEVAADLSNKVTIDRTDPSDAFLGGDSPLLPRLDEKLCGSARLSIFLSRIRSGHEGDPVSWSWRALRCGLSSLMAEIEADIVAFKSVPECFRK